MRTSAAITEALNVLPLVALVSLRVAIMLALLPAPFGELAPARIRAALSFVLAFALTLPTLGDAHQISLEPAPLLISGLTELLVGAVIGLTVRVTLAAAEAAGTLTGTAMGLGFANQIDPLFGDEGVPTTTLISVTPISARRRITSRRCSSRSSASWRTSAAALSSSAQSSCTWPAIVVHSAAKAA